MQHSSPFKMVLDFRDLVFVVVPSLTGCSIAVMDRASEREPWSDTWPEVWCDKASSLTTMNVLGLITMVGETACFMCRPGLRNRVLFCAEKVSQFVSWSEFDTRLVRSKSDEETLRILSHAILGLYVVDPSVNKLVRYIETTTECFYNGIPAFLSKCEAVSGG